MDLIATCRQCNHQERLPEGAAGVTLGRGVERWCGGCKGTTWQFVGYDAAEMIKRHAEHVPPLRRSGR